MNRKKQKVICILLLAGNLLVIWGNSLLPGEISGDISSGVLAFFTEWFGQVFGEHFLRKLAHFSEFACLGLLMGWLMSLLGQEKLHRFTMPLLFTMMAACLDETIQVFVPGRGPSVIDVWIDTAGAAAGIGLLLLGQTISRRNIRIPLEVTKHEKDDCYDAGPDHDGCGDDGLRR